MESYSQHIFPVYCHFGDMIDLVWSQKHVPVLMHGQQYLLGKVKVSLERRPFTLQHRVCTDFWELPTLPSGVPVWLLLKQLTDRSFFLSVASALRLSRREASNMRQLKSRSPDAPRKWTWCCLKDPNLQFPFLFANELRHLGTSLEGSLAFLEWFRVICWVRVPLFLSAPIFGERVRNEC